PLTVRHSFNSSESRHEYMFFCTLFSCHTSLFFFFFFFFNHPAPTELYTLSLHDALPISLRPAPGRAPSWRSSCCGRPRCNRARRDRKSTRLNSSHDQISYAVFCLKKKKKENRMTHTPAIEQS